MENDVEDRSGGLSYSKSPIKRPLKNDVINDLAQGAPKSRNLFKLPIGEDKPNSKKSTRSDIKNIDASS